MKNPVLFRQDLTRWFKKAKRVLPWRQKRTPYATWISEIMLQQTQVKTVVPYFKRWMRDIPSIRALGKTAEHKILNLWQGLGYYSRARNLKKGAQYLIQNHHGRMPQTLDEILRIPGIGKYSAGAILSIAFNKKAPIVDGNVLRVLARLYALQDPIDEERTKESFYKLQSALVPAKNPGIFNEGLMEFGALICTPKAPLCTICPVRRHCLAFEKKLVGQLPKKSRLKKITKVHAYAVVLNRNGKYFIHKRPEGQIMGGLWEFPEWKMAEGTKPNEKSQASLLSKELGVQKNSLLFLKSIKRHYTRFAENLSVYSADVQKTPPALKNEWQQKWVGGNELKSFPLTSAHAKIRSLLLSI